MGALAETEAQGSAFDCGEALNCRSRGWGRFCNSLQASPLPRINAGCAVMQGMTRWRPADTAAKVDNRVVGVQEMGH